MSEARCGYCGRRFDRPSFGCPPGVGGEDHAQGTLADRIVDAVEAELNDRRALDWDRPGLDWEGQDDDTLDELRETLAGKIAHEILNWLGQAVWLKPGYSTLAEARAAAPPASGASMGHGR